jgi:8-oxo-dGTP pyrophosphatase MutT (NUDIX family)
MTPESFAQTLASTVARYLGEVAAPSEHLSLLRWQIAQGHRLDLRETMPGHLTTSAIVLSPDHSQILLIDHVTIGRWLQPGGHYEPAPAFHLSAQREAEEETGVAGLALHPWHKGQDLPFVIDSHDVRGKASRNETVHVHHDLQYLFLADPTLPLVAQLEEVHDAKWQGVERLWEFAPKAAERLKTVAAPGQSRSL